MQRMKCRYCGFHGALFRCDRASERADVTNVSLRVADAEVPRYLYTEMADILVTHHLTSAKEAGEIINSFSSRR